MANITTLIRTIVAVVAALIVIGLGFYIIHLRSTSTGVLRVDAGPRGGDIYFLMTQLSEVVERNSTSLRLEVVETDGVTGHTAERLKNGLDLSTIQSHTPTLPNTLLVSELYEEVFQLFTRTDTGINEVNDLAGKRVALPIDGSSDLQFFWAIGDHYNLFVQDVTWVSLPYQERINAFAKGEVDGFFTVGTARNFATLKLIEDFDHLPEAAELKMIAIDQAPAMAVKRPYIESVVIEKGTFDGNPPLPAHNLVTGAIRRLLVASDKADANLVAELTRVLFENRADLSVRFPLANRIKAPNLSSGLRLPLHPGALRYYTRDEPSFIQKNAEPLTLFITIITMLVSALFAVRSRLIATQKNRADFFNREALKIGERIRTHADQSALLTEKQELDRLLEEAVDALDRDQVTDSGFLSFAFLWQTVAKGLEERL